MQNCGNAILKFKNIAIGDKHFTRSTTIFFFFFYYGVASANLGGFSVGIENLKLIF